MPVAADELARIKRDLTRGLSEAGPYVSVKSDDIRAILGMDLVYSKPEVLKSEPAKEAKTEPKK